MELSFFICSVNRIIVYLNTYHFLQHTCDILAEDAFELIFFFVVACSVAVLSSQTCSVCQFSCCALWFVLDFYSFFFFFFCVCVCVLMLWKVTFHVLSLLIKHAVVWVFFFKYMNSILSCLSYKTLCMCAHACAWAVCIWCLFVCLRVQSLQVHVEKTEYYTVFGFFTFIFTLFLTSKCCFYVTTFIFPQTVGGRNSSVNRVLGLIQTSSEPPVEGTVTWS